MKNLQKLKRSDLKTIKGGIIPVGCLSWDVKTRCCRSWEPNYCNNATCPDSPPPAC